MTDVQDMTDGIDAGTQHGLVEPTEPLQASPFELMEDAVKNNTKVVISCRNNHKLVGYLKAYDQHCNMILEEVRDLWNEPIRNQKGEITKTNARERYIHKMFLRGDTVVVVLKP